MSSLNMTHNLSFSINLPKTNVHSTDIIQAVNQTFTKLSNGFKLQYSPEFFNLLRRTLPENKTTPIMLSEKTVLCEVNAGLWDKGLTSAISSITSNTCPHISVVQGFINYLLNSHLNINFGLVEEFFWKLLLSHSPKPELYHYYQPILFDHFLSIYKRKLEDQNLFICIIDALTTCLQNPEFSSPKLETTNPNTNEQQLLEGLGNFNRTVLGNYSLNQKNVTYFEDLPWNEKIKRCLIALNFVYNILEIDFVIWLQANESQLHSLKKGNQPLICRCVWQDIRDIGVISKDICKILNAFKLFEQLEDDSLPHFDVFRKLITLLAEVFKCLDRTEKMKYPFIGTKLNNFARELSLKLHEYLFDSYDENQLFKADELIKNLKPHWFRLILCSNLISNVIGSQCPPDLTGACDVLEHIALTSFSTIADKTRSRKRTEKLRAMDLKLSQRHKKLKSINAKLSNGNTRLQTACEKNNVREMKALLKLSDLDVNATNHEGWTALHIASYKGHKEIVYELLRFRPYSESLQKAVDTRARGPENNTPLMCAASEGHGDICRLLLEHTGSVLLEDINESNQTPLELAKNEEVSEIMKHYVDNVVRTPHSHKNIEFDDKYKEIVIKLCVEMIQSYFCTYKTWDVYKSLKNRENGYSDDLEVQPDWDYERYYRDIKRNIYTLRKLTLRLQDVQEFESSFEIFSRILSFNKSC